MGREDFPTTQNHSTGGRKNYHTVTDPGF